MQSLQELLIHEIYCSVQGESSFVGLPCIFVRTTGCRLRCVWCDTKHAYHEGSVFSFSQIQEALKKWPYKLVEFTGGEPLEQPQIADLMQVLVDDGYTVLVETGGHVDIGFVPEAVHKIVDMKAPGSKMQKKNHYQNLNLVGRQDEVKFVLADRQDYEWSLKLIREYNLEAKTNLLFSTVFGVLPPDQVVEWMLKDGVNARFQLQMHKYIWDPDKRAV